jgi:8-oxo-dGTP diphosphatase
MRCSTAWSKARPNAEAEPRESPVTDGRSYPKRPHLAVSAAIIRDGKVLIVRRARPPARGLFTLPGGGVEAGETLHEAIIREVREETALTIEPIGLAGHREVIARDDAGKIERHFVILPFAARWVRGDVVLNEELAEAHWLAPAELAGLATTEGLADIVRAAFAIAG